MSEPKPIYKPGFVEIRGDDDKLLFRFDPNRDLIEIKPKNGRLQVVDLQPYRQEHCTLLFFVGDELTED